MRSISFRTVALLFTNCSFLYYKDLLLPFISRLMRSISRKTFARLFPNCSCFYFKVLLLYSLYFTSHDVLLSYFFLDCSYIILKLLFHTFKYFPLSSISLTYPDIYFFNLAGNTLSYYSCFLCYFSILVA